MTRVVSLEEISRDQIAVAGGKGANLGELIQQKFPVPPGFVVTAGAYAQSVSDWDLVGQAPQQIQRLIMAQRIDPDLDAELQAHHQLLAKKIPREFVYAVRSSATAEDLGDASFAGQHDTYYYVTADQLTEMVKKCWSSLWSEAACSYRQSHGIPHHTVNMAVVVQLMVESDISGITFTANPISGNTDEILTEASWGMGAAIVDGRVSPDQYVFSRRQNEVISKRIADKKFMVPASLQESESRLIAVPASLRSKETLSKNQFTTLINWALKSESYFDKPQDLEWAFHGEEFYILQSRPITTLEQAGDEIPEGEFVLFKPMAENFTDPLLPLSQDILRRMFPMMQIIRGRVYLNIAHIKPLFPFKMDSQQIAQIAYLSGAIEQRPSLSPLKLIGLLAIGYFSYLMMAVFNYRTASLPDDFMHSFRQRFNDVVNDEKIDAPGAMEKLFFRPKFFEPVGNMVFLVNLSAPRYMLLMGLLEKLLKFWAPNLRQDAASYLTSGTEGILSTDMGRHIWFLSEQARLSPIVVDIICGNESHHALEMLRNEFGAVPFMLELNKFLAIHGHRTLKEFELNSVRWDEDPAPIVAMLKNYLQTDADPTRTEHRVKDERVRFTSEVRNLLAGKFLESSFGWRWKIIDALCQRTKYYIRLRENSRFFHIMGFYAVRKKVLKAEAELLQQGELKCKDDIFYLDWVEIQELQAGKLNWLDVEDRIRNRRMNLIRLSKLTPPKTFGVVIEEAAQEGEANHILGQGASPGECEGIARVIMDPAIDATVLPGEILVAPYTDPAWTPLFLTASAAVVEVGSYLSHAGTIAREYGLPCVVDATNCTTRLKTGDRIRVNGSNGKVVLLNNGEDSNA
ncbi:MAG: pyruvate,water dikinase [Candidatus Azotimanducaceae bacterium]|jgi:pyruvate,water dikinase